MLHYDYCYPDSLTGAFEALDLYPDGKVLAGGTDLLVRIRQGQEAPSVLIDITRAGLDYFEIAGNLLRIGATTPLARLANDPWLKERLTVLSEAAQEIGAAQTRNLGTVGGNICTGVPSADLAPPLLVLGAGVKIKGINNERVLPLEEFFLGPRQINVGAKEIVTEIQVDLPPKTRKGGSAFAKLGKRRAMRLAIVNAAAYVETEGDVLTKVHLAMGTVAPVPLRLYQTESFLTGKGFSETLIAQAIQVMQTEINPRDSLRASATYRRQVAAVLLREVISKSFGRAQDRG